MASDLITAKNNLIIAQQQVASLIKLLALDDSGMCRRLGFRENGDLIVDGDWLTDLDDGSTDTCIPCGTKLLLAGDWDPESVHAFYLSIGEPDEDIHCSKCGAELYVAQEEEEE